jgi:radical SAM enzyme (TIGR01210 family)
VSYPATASERDRWILSLRPERNVLDPLRPYAFLTEPETGPDGAAVDVATLFLTNRECPFRCLMCDLWRNTLEQSVPPGAIPDQIRFALDQLSPARWIKLYNAGSFFDPKAIPPSDYPEIARLCARFERVIVECHPSFVGERVLEFQRLIAPARLEVAMGLETVHPEVLPRLNKRMTLDQFRQAAGWLRAHELDLRVFILVRPPWLSEEEGVEWACRSLDFASECEATASYLIPTRDGNGALEALRESGEWSPPALRSLEKALEYGLGLRTGRVFADLWDVQRFSRCAECGPQRISRLSEMNRTQRLVAPVVCSSCEGRA